MFADAQLAKRLDGVNRLFYRAAAAAYAELWPNEAPPILELEHSAALFAGQGSPLTQAGGTFEPDELVAIADFYRGRTDAYEAVLTPLAGDEALSRVMAVGGTVMQWENLLYRDTTYPFHAEEPHELEIVEAAPDDLDRWEAIGRQAFWSNPTDPIAKELGELLKRMPGRRYIALWGGEPAASASMSIYDGVAFLGGAGTLPAFRGKGIQAVLIARRVADAKDHADLAFIGASPGSASQRNAERCGFKIAFSQLSLRVPIS